MKCPYCHGEGKIKTIKLISAEQGFDCVEEVCTKCNGSGEYEQTNEEWLKSLNTEQLAEWIADKSNEIISWIICEVIENECDVDEDDYWQKKSDVWEWLKQPHNEKE